MTMLNIATMALFGAVLAENVLDEQNSGLTRELEAKTLWDVV